MGRSRLFSNTGGIVEHGQPVLPRCSATPTEDQYGHWRYALFSNTTGKLNTATGFSALSTNTDGQLNTADGIQALRNNTTGEQHSHRR